MRPAGSVLSMASSIVLSGMEDDLSCFVILCEVNLLAGQIWEEM